MANQQSNTSTDSVEQHNLDDNTEAMLHEKEPSVEPEARSITILYGSESGNAQGLAEIFEQRLSDIGNDVTLKSMDDFKPKNLKKVEDLYYHIYMAKEIHQITLLNYMNTSTDVKRQNWMG